MLITRRTLLTSSAGGLAALSLSPNMAWAAELPKLKIKDVYKVGFAQTESNNPWRLAQTQSMKDEAAKRGWQLVYTDAAGSAAKEVADVRSMIAQRVDVILLAPPRGEAAGPRRHGGHERWNPAFLYRSQRRRDPGQAGPRLCCVHRVRLRQGRADVRRTLREGSRRQGEDYPA